ncbi:Cytohesin guanine nucleotide-exchange protein [Fasciola gigantica]|uniref:Cytohesin guanine nucleotide-exchange protein n=1 Tax=Fasciola gigantica TaxID=46835 RepID=A0A504YVC6_FASGI|nr:Cytohesin guanine nucleotide-exchange protein [Fasciola gigantica]
MECKTSESIFSGPPPPPPLLSVLNPAPGRFKPRARLLSIRPRRSPRLCIKNNTEQQAIQRSKVPPMRTTQMSSVRTPLTCAQSNESDQISGTVGSRCSQPIQKFMKRFSVRFTPTSQPEAHTAELVKRAPSRFSFSTWRRRKSLSQIDNTQDRDRSPLKAACMALDEQWAMFRSTEHSVPDNKSIISSQMDLEDKENEPCRQSKNTQQHQWTTKRRSLWNFSFTSVGLNSESSVTNHVTAMSPSSVAPPLSTCLPRFPGRASYSACPDPDCSPRTQLSTPCPCTRKCPKHSYPSVTVCRQRRRSTLRPDENPSTKNDNTIRALTSSSVSLGLPDDFQSDGMAMLTDLSTTDRTGSITPILSSSAQESEPCSSNRGPQGHRLTFIPLPSSQQNATLWHSCDRLSRCSLESNFSQPEWPADKPHNQDSGVSSEVSTGSARTVDTIEIMMESDSTEPSIARTKGTNVRVEIPRVEVTDLSESATNIHRFTTCRSPSFRKSDPVWNSRLRRSLNLAGRQCHLLAGRTLFNKNPEEGMQYLLDHGLIPPVPVAIARFLLDETELSRQAIGEYFGALTNNMASRVLREYIQLLDMKNLEVDEALRVVLSHFHPVGESQKISHLMQTFQEIYTAQNMERVAEKFHSPDTIEILAYSILLLHTDLHNPNVRRVGKRMTKNEFVTNNRGIDAEQDLPADMLHAIYDRVAETQFKTLPDPFDRLRTLDSLLIGPLKTDNFLQRHRRFVGWTSSHQVDNIISRRSPKRPHGRSRHLFVFNDILIVAKPVASGSLLNLAAAAALGEPVTSSAVSYLNRRTSLPVDRIVEHRPRPRAGTDIRSYHSTLPMASGTYHVRLVLPLVDLRVLLFETPYHHFGVQLCNPTGPILNVNLASSEAREDLVDWIHHSTAEMTELRRYYQMKSENKSLTNVLTEPEHCIVPDVETRL